MSTNFTTPGVYINELNAFPNSVTPVATAIPAFIGYTPRASYNGKSYTGVPVPISSWQEFLLYFAALDPVTAQPLPAQQQSSPVFYPTATTAPTPDLVIAGHAYDVRPDAGTLFYLWHSVQLFYQNGGGACYVVSVGPYGPLRQNAGSPKSAPLVNPNVRLADLSAALTALQQVPAVTLIVIPDATLLPAADYATLAQQTLAHCGTMQTCVALLDVLGGAAPNPQTWFNDTITPFRTAVGLQSLSYGAAYYPFLQTTVLAATDLDYRNVGGGAAALSALLPGAATAPLKNLLAQIGSTAPGTPTPAQLDTALRTASPAYAQLQAVMLAQANILPPSGAVAGVYTLVDNQSGVWRAPANVSPTAVTGTTLAINDTMQASLNVDAATGKSINAIRVFPALGPVIWGARTLDGNSDDWRYVNVRRTVIMLEQSIKLALQPYIFSANTASTWSLATSTLNNFLTNQWAQGALAGATPAAAFSVACGLGSTMTSADILNGVLNVSVKVAISHPAEFIVINFQQIQQTS